MSLSGSSIPSATLHGLHFGDIVWIGVGGYSFDDEETGFNSSYTIRADIGLDVLASPNGYNSQVPIPVHRLLNAIPQV